MASGIKALAALRGPQAGTQETIYVTVEKIRFRNNRNLFTIGEGTRDGAKKPVTFLGKIIRTYVGCKMELYGTWVDTQYGLEFQIIFANICRPKNLYEVKVYLSQIKDIGEKLADAIVSYFRQDTLDIIQNWTFRLTEIKGISNTRANNIYACVRADFDIEELNKFLATECKLDSMFTYDVYYTFNKSYDLAVASIKANPYVLLRVPDITFPIADKAAMELGVQPTSQIRIRQAILHELRTVAESSGHTYMVAENLRNAVDDNLLQIGNRSLIQKEIVSMCKSGELKGIYYYRSMPYEFKQIHAIYLPYYYTEEMYCATKLVQMLSNSVEIPSSALRLNGPGTEDYYVQEQIDAVKTAMQSSVMVLTGGPGTGKTTVTKEIISTFKNAGLSVLCAAPTGRAAKRMEEATGTKAQTIHRLLRYKTSTESFDVNAENPLTCDALIVDEMSMVDVCLLAAVLRALPETSRLIMIGDVDQLAAVNAGDVLHSIIASECIPVSRLEKIHRQGSGSGIVRAIYNIRNGIMPLLDPDENAESQFIAVETAADAAQLIVKQLLPKYKSTDVQVLTPIQRNTKENEGSSVSSINLNQYTQKILNPKVYIGDTRDPTTFVYCGEKRTFIQGEAITSEIPEFRVGDKVIQTRNDYDKEVFNGDIGVVIGTIDSDDPGEGKQLVVMFDEKEVVYGRRDLRDLSLAYAITVHKAQGSEFPVVIVPITEGIPKSMLQRNLLYTAVSRAKSKLILVGSRRAIMQAVQNTKASKRNSALDVFIKCKANEAKVGIT